MSEKEKNKNNNHKKFDLQQFLIDYFVKIIHVYKQLSDTKAVKYIRFKILKSGSLPSANYVEAQNTKYRSDFIYCVSQLI